MLPFFDDRGDFPAGVHVGSWLEVDERLGSSTPKRVRLMATLRHLHALASQTGHLSRFIIFGSFVTNTPEPRDLDLVLVMAEAFRLEDAPRESQTLFSHADADARFGASVFWIREGILPTSKVAEFLGFWRTRRDGGKRGIVEVRS